MKRTPCEEHIWNCLPAIRKELAFCIIEEFHLSQKETAEKLGLTPAAVSQYMSKKRGRNRITDKEALEEIKKSAERIVKEGDSAVIKETCRLCKFLSKKESLGFSCMTCD